MNINLLACFIEYLFVYLLDNQILNILQKKPPGVFSQKLRELFLTQKHMRPIGFLRPIFQEIENNLFQAQFYF